MSIHKPVEIVICDFCGLSGEATHDGRPSSMEQHEDGDYHKFCHLTYQNQKRLEEANTRQKESILRYSALH